MLYKLQNGKLITPPTTGTKRNGETVSGYNRLSPETLKAEGWKDYIIEEPERKEGYEYIPYYIEDDTTIYLRYREELIPEPEIEPEGGKDAGTEIEN